MGITVAAYVFECYDRIFIVCFLMQHVSSHCFASQALPILDGGNPVRIISCNIKGLNGPVKGTTIFSHLKQLKTDVIPTRNTLKIGRP